MPMHRFRRPRKLTRRERDLVTLALHRDPPPNVKAFLRQVRHLKVIGRDQRFRPGGVWEVIFDDRPTGRIFTVLAIGRTATDPTSIGLFIDGGSGKIMSMEVFENDTGRPPFLISVR